MSVINIPEWNARVEAAFENAKVRIPSYEKELNMIMNVLKTSLSLSERSMLTTREQELKTIIEDLTNDVSFSFYLIEAQSIVSEYLSEDTKPIPFMKKDRKVSSKSKDLSRTFIEILQKYNHLLQLDLPSTKSTEKKSPECACGNMKDFETINDDLYCLKCSSLVSESKLRNQTFSDSDRSQAHMKYKYARIINIKNAIRRYQGKQRVRISDKLIEDVKKQIALNGIPIEKLRPQHIRNALQETGYVKNYENSILIWSRITGKDPPDISSIEDKILADFELVESEYNKLVCSDERSSFMSYSYILYQLLLRNSPQKPDTSFFHFLKPERIEWHNQILSKIYCKLEWAGFVPLD